MTKETKNLTPKFKIGDIVKTNEYHLKIGQKLFGRDLHRILKGAKITAIINKPYELTEEYPVSYITDHPTVNMINEIFLQKATFINNNKGD